MLLLLLLLLLLVLLLLLLLLPLITTFAKYVLISFQWLPHFSVLLLSLAPCCFPLLHLHDKPRSYNGPSSPQMEASKLPAAGTTTHIQLLLYIYMRLLAHQCHILVKATAAAIGILIVILGYCCCRCCCYCCCPCNQRLTHAQTNTHYSGLLTDALKHFWLLLNVAATTLMLFDCFHLRYSHSSRACCCCQLPPAVTFHYYTGTQP